MSGSTVQFWVDGNVGDKHRTCYMIKDGVQKVANGFTTNDALVSVEEMRRMLDEYGLDRRGCKVDLIYRMCLHNEKTGRTPEKRKQKRNRKNAIKKPVVHATELEQGMPAAPGEAELQQGMPLPVDDMPPAPGEAELQQGMPLLVHDMPPAPDEHGGYLAENGWFHPGAPPFPTIHDWLLCGLYLNR